MKLDKKSKEVIKKLTNKYNLSEEEVIEIIQSPFIFIRKTITSIDLTNVKSDEEFEKTIKNFNIPYIGKLYGNIYNFKRIKNELKRNKRRNQEKQT